MRGPPPLVLHRRAEPRLRLVSLSFRGGLPCPTSHERVEIGVTRAFVTSLCGPPTPYRRFVSSSQSRCGVRRTLEYSANFTGVAPGPPVTLRGNTRADWQMPFLKTLPH
jgi:hypothetical protein